jgi:hypothetical protein
MIFGFVYPVLILPMEEHLLLKRFAPALQFSFKMYFVSFELAPTSWSINGRVIGEP